MKQLFATTLLILLAAGGVFALHFGQRSSQAEREKIPNITEISLERIYDGCIGCPDHKVVIQRESGDIFKAATVTYIDRRTKTQRQGSLSNHYYNNLLRLIKTQGYFEMKGGYALGVMDGLRVNISIVHEGKRKSIRTTSEGEVPISLWGIYMAIDGVVAKTEWESSK